MMERTLLFATSNEHKLSELKLILPSFDIKGLKDIGILEEIPEDGDTLEENAWIKAKYLYDKTGLTSLSEDTGLEVNALNNHPGVHTARYAGDQKNADDNIDKLLLELKDIENRSAQFRTIICYFDGIGSHFFEGIVKGKIAKERLGAGGFGYDPVFIPEGFQDTFAVLDPSIKSKISHRARAVSSLLSFLNP